MRHYPLESYILSTRGSFVPMEGWKAESSAVFGLHWQFIPGGLTSRDAPGRDRRTVRLVVIVGFLLKCFWVCSGQKLPTNTLQLELAQKDLWNHAPSTHLFTFLWVCPRAGFLLPPRAASEIASQPMPGWASLWLLLALCYAVHRLFPMV